MPFAKNTIEEFKLLNEAIRNISKSASVSNVYLLDLDSDYNDYFKYGVIRESIVNGHYTANGYSAISRINEIAISNVMNEHVYDFMSIPFIPFGSNDVIN